MNDLFQPWSDESQSVLDIMSRRHPSAFFRFVHHKHLRYNVINIHSAPTQDAALGATLDTADFDMVYVQFCM
jgi:hypothetical protein